MKSILSFALSLANSLPVLGRRPIKKTLLLMAMICLIFGVVPTQGLEVAYAQQSPTARIDGRLLNLIDQYADDYYPRDEGGDPIWDLTLDQYKSWIATIAWAEGGWGEGAPLGSVII